jgi:hypothetical protein
LEAVNARGVGVGVGAGYVSGRRHALAGVAHDPAQLVTST